MKQSVQISGMTCSGCVNSVTEQLQEIEGVETAEVSLETGEARLTVVSPISIDRIQQGLSDSYSVQSPGDKGSATAEEAPVKGSSKLRQLLPLFIAFVVIALTAAIIGWLSTSARMYMFDFMGLFYLVFGGLKLIDYRNFPSSFAMYDPLAARWQAYAWAYPFIELVLGVLLLSTTGVPYALGATVVLLGITTVGVLRSLLSKQSIRCACMGTALKLPMTEATLIENVLMIGMAIAGGLSLM
jgi:copper chaperone CopZ